MVLRAYNLLLHLAALLPLASAAFFGCSSSPPLETVKEVDLRKYMGRWYEIARLPNRFQEGCTCTTAEYEMTAQGYVKVTNRCRKDSATGEVEEARGKAFIVEGSNNARLKVQFFWPFRGDYYIIDLASDYSYALVGHPNRKYLWILSRTPRMEEGLYQRIIERAAQSGFDIGKLLRTDQDCN